MTDVEIRDYLDGFMAWDHGCRSSGIKDDRKREEVREYLHILLSVAGGTRFRELVWPLIVRNGPAGPYGIEDIQETLNWLCEFCGRDDWSGV